MTTLGYSLNLKCSLYYCSVSWRILPERPVCGFVRRFILLKGKLIKVRNLSSGNTRNLGIAYYSSFFSIFSTLCLSWRALFLIPESSRRRSSVARYLWKYWNSNIFQRFQIFSRQFQYFPDNSNIFLRDQYIQNFLWNQIIFYGIKEFSVILQFNAQLKKRTFFFF